MEREQESGAIIARTMMSIIFVLSVLMLVLTGCEQHNYAVAAFNSSNRTVAKIYKIKAETNVDRVECYRINTNGRSPMTILKKNQLVNIVAIEQGLRRFDGELWLNVYPPLSHRPNCYVNINNLIPYS